MSTGSIRQLIDDQAERAPDTIFLIDPETGQTVTFAQLRQAVQSLAHAIHNRGIKPGRSVAFAMANGADTALAILALYYGGFRATAVNLQAGPETIAYVLDHSKSELVIADDAGAALIAQANPASTLTTVAQLTGEAPNSSATLPPIAPSDDGLLMYTSGTTGRPKGVRLSHRALIAGGHNTAIAHQLTARDRALCVLPLYHINGMCVTLMAPLLTGGAVVMPRKFSPAKFWPLIADHQCSWFSVVPTQISYLLHQPEQFLPAMPQLRFGRSASAPLAPETQRAFENRFNVPIIETMGLTETAAQILANPLPPGIRKIGSPGIAFGNQIKIAGAHGNALPANQEGEVLVNGANVMTGYLDNPDATQAAFFADGWLRTGDLGRMDTDGYVFITGRLKELIIKGGENIAPREIDDVLYAQPGIIEAAAFARACPDYGERVEAAVVLDPAVTCSEASLINACQAKIGKFKAPDRIHFLAELPKGPSGKIQRRSLASLTGQAAK